MEREKERRVGKSKLSCIAIVKKVRYGQRGLLVPKLNIKSFKHPPNLRIPARVNH